VGACTNVPSLVYDTPLVVLGGEGSSGLALQLDRSQKPSLPGLPSLWVEDLCGRYRESNRSQVSLRQLEVYVGRSPLNFVEVVDWGPEVYRGLPLQREMGRWVP
jgi:hypothetical protein